MQKIRIKNRKGQTIVVVLEKPVHPESTTQKELVFIMHGLGGYKEQIMLRTIAESFLTHGYAVVTFDTTNTFGESDGRLDDATTTNYIEDLEDVINWARKGTDLQQSEWYTEPFCLVGHSLGGISTAYFAEKNPHMIKAIAPISTVVSGQLSTEANPERTALWKKLGYEEQRSNSRPWLVAQIPWSHMEDRLRYDLLSESSKLTMPVLMIVGTEDELTPPAVEQVLFDRLPGKKELHQIEGAPHTFKDPMHLAQIKRIFDAWIESL